MEKQTTAVAEPGRRQFLGAAAAALFAGVAIQFTGCSTDDDAPSTNAGDKSATSISGNHGHKAVITKVQLDAGGAVTLDISGSAGHTHTFALSAEEVVSIKAGTMVMKDTGTTSSHSHSIMFN